MATLPKPTLLSNAGGTVTIGPPPALLGKAYETRWNGGAATLLAAGVSFTQRWLETDGRTYAFQVRLPGGPWSEELIVTPTKEQSVVLTPAPAASAPVQPAQPTYTLEYTVAGKAPVRVVGIVSASLILPEGGGFTFDPQKT